jgi:type VI secretion system protein ImpK
MRDDIAEVVFKVVQKGIDLKQRRERDEQIDCEATQAALLARLNDALLGESSQENLGARFALACWLDEILIDESSWGQTWSRDYSLEFILYGTKRRANRFWEGQRQAEARQGNDALEVYFLCFMLGFRGDFMNDAAELQSRADRMRPQVIRSYGPEPPKLDNSTPQNHVPELSGRQGFQGMLKLWGVLLLILAFALGFFLVKKI